jgi:hypothetical protein
MSDTIIESLGIEINSNSKDVVNGVDALVQSLNKLKPASKHATSGLDVFSKALTNLKSVVQSTESSVTEITSQLSSVNGAASAISSKSIDNVTAISSALRSLNGVKIPKNIDTRLTAISTVLSNFNIGDSITRLQDLGDTLKSLTNMPKLDIAKNLKEIKKLPETFAEVEKMDMGKVATQVKALANALHPLGDEMQRISNGFSAFPTKLQQLIASTDRWTNSNRKAARSFTDVFHIVKTGMSFFKRLGSVIRGFITESNDYVENVNLFTVSMGKYADEAKAYAQTVSDTIGIDTSEWMRAQGVFMTISTGFGIAGDRAAKMSQQLTQLGYDISSFYNISVENAMDKLKSGLAGELEPLRAIGYDLSQAKLEATALALGIDKSVSSMTQAEKAQLRYYAIMTQVTQVQGDMARTLEEPANQLRVLKAQTTMAAREIGNVFIPALNAVLPYAIAVTKVVGNLASVIAGLVGYEAPDLSGSTGEAVVNTDAIQENMEGAKEEAKKLKSYMLGFDELNIINPNTDSVAEDTSGMFDFELPEYNFLDNLAESRVNGIVEKMKEWLGLTEDIQSWGDLLETNFGNILVTVGLIAVGLTTWKITKSVLDIVNNIDAFKTAVKSFKKVGSVALAAVGISAVSAVAVASAKWLMEHTDDTITKIGAILSAAFLVVGSVLAFTGVNLPLGIALMAVGALSMGTAIALNTDKISDEVKGVIAVVTGAVSVALLAVGAILAFSGVNLPLGIALLLGGALALATAVVPNWSVIETTLEGPIGVVTTLVGGAMLALGAILAFSGVGLPLGIALMAVGAASLATAAVVNWDKIVETLEGPVGAITALVGGALLVLGMILLFSGVGIPLGLGLILGGAAALGTVVAVNWDFISDKVKEIWGKVKDYWNNNIAQVFTAKWWKDLGITIMNGFIAGIEGGINGVIGAFESMINWVVNGLNKISFTVPDWVPEIGGQVVGVSLSTVSFDRVSIPRFAEGGFPEQGQMFIAREAGAEMVGNIGRRTAVANNEQIVESISVGVAEANSEQNALLREQNALLRELVAKDSGVYLDGRSLSDSVDKYKREKGRVLITGGVV